MPNVISSKSEVKKHDPCKLKAYNQALSHRQQWLIHQAKSARTAKIELTQTDQQECIPNLAKKGHGVDQLDFKPDQIKKEIYPDSVHTKDIIKRTQTRIYLHTAATASTESMETVTLSSDALIGMPGESLVSARFLSHENMRLYLEREGYLHESPLSQDQDQLVHLQKTEKQLIDSYEHLHLSQIFVDDIGYLFEELKAAGQRFFTYSQLPQHLRDNTAIWTGYRAHYTFKECVKSVFQLHNETGNIWTHLLGALFFIICVFMCWTGALALVPPEGEFADYVMLTIFLVSASKCLLCSTIFHTFSAHAHSAIYDAVAILDYTGISILIFGSFTIVVHYGLYCWPALRWTYTAILGTLCLSGIVLPWFRFFRAASFRIYRALFFVALGFASGAVAIHTVCLNGWHFMNLLAPMELYILEVLFYLAGVVIYARRIPEIWFPGRLDRFLHSHQLWHVFVFMGAFTHYAATLSLMHARITQDTCSAAFRTAAHTTASYIF